MTHPDQAILDAWAAACALKAEGYADDEKPQDQQRTQEEEQALDDRLQELESVVENTPATTPQGVICRLQNTLVRADQSLWVDRLLSEEGPEAVYDRREELETFEAQQIMEAIHDLERMDPLRPFAEAWLERWTAIGGAVGISSIGRRLYYQPEPDGWTAPPQNEALKPHQQITDPTELAGAAKALSGLLSLVPGGGEAVWQIAVERGVALTPPTEAVT